MKTINATILLLTGLVFNGALAGAGDQTVAIQSFCEKISPGDAEKQKICVREHTKAYQEALATFNQADAGGVTAKLWEVCISLHMNEDLQVNWIETKACMEKLKNQTSP